MRCASVFVALAAVALAALPATHAARTYCSPGDSCWPSTAEVDALSSALDPNATRFLYWKGINYARPCAVGVSSPGQQPLYGAGTKPMAPVYVNSTTNATAECFVGGYVDEFCLMTTRNSPYWNHQPAFMAWPLTAQHVQAAVTFAVKHNLRVCVAGTGHDFLNRHSCQDGFLIRTSLLNSVAYTGSNSLRVGSGVTFAQLEQAVSGKRQYVASGWAPTVGIAGWSIGGGHGPFGCHAGLGVDNILSVELVVADGSLVTANASGTLVVTTAGESTWSSDTELYRALRGGGSSTWGVMTALTIRTHDTPPGGITFSTVLWAGAFFNESATLEAVLAHQLEWSYGLGSKWSGLTWYTPKYNATLGFTVWEVMSQYVYLGGKSDPEYQQVWGAYAGAYGAYLYVNESYTFDPWWQYINIQALEPIIPMSVYEPHPGSTGGVPSVLASREAANKTLGPLVLAHMLQCKTATSPCSNIQLYQDITGNIGSPQATDTALSDGFRTAMYHVVLGTADPDVVDAFYSLGPNSYFSESAYTMDGWQERYWGTSDNYARLLAVKNKWDPTGVFGCHHCVGDDGSYE